MAGTGVGIIVIVIILVPILFQVVMHNIQMKKYYNRIEERLVRLESELEKLSK